MTQQSCSASESNPGHILIYHIPVPESSGGSGDRRPPSTPTTGNTGKKPQCAHISHSQIPPRAGSESDRKPLTLLPALQATGCTLRIPKTTSWASASWDLFHISTVSTLSQFDSSSFWPTWICCLRCCSSWVPREVSAGGILPSVSLSHFLTAPTRFRNSSSCSWQDDASFSLGVKRFWRVRARALPCSYPLLNAAWLCL